MEKIEKLLLTPEEVGAAISMSTRIVYQMVASGELRSIRMNRAVRIPVESLREWMKKMENSSRTGANDDGGGGAKE